MQLPLLPLLQAAYRQPWISTANCILCPLASLSLNVSPAMPNKALSCQTQCRREQPPDNTVNTQVHLISHCLLLSHCAKKPVTTMLTYPWKCTVLHCNHLGNTWKPLVLMTRHFDYYPNASEGDNQSVGSSAPVVSRCFPGGYNVKLYISRGRLARWLLAFLCCVSAAVCCCLLLSAAVCCCGGLSKLNSKKCSYEGLHK